MGVVAVMLYAGLVLLENKKAGKSDGKEGAKKLYL